MAIKERRRRQAAAGATFGAFVALALALFSSRGHEQWPQGTALAPNAALGEAAQVTRELSSALPPAAVEAPSEPAAAEAAAPEPPPIVPASSPLEAPRAVAYCPGDLPVSGSPCAAADGEVFVCSYPQQGAPVTCHCQGEGDVPASWSCLADSEQPSQATGWLRDTSEDGRLER